VLFLTFDTVLHTLSERLEKDIAEMMISKGDVKKSRDRRNLRAPLEEARREALKEESLQEEFEQEQQVLFETRRAEDRVRFLRTMRSSGYPGTGYHFGDGVFPGDEIYDAPRPSPGPPGDIGPHTGRYVFETGHGTGPDLYRSEPNTGTVRFEDEPDRRPTLSRWEPSTGTVRFESEPDAAPVRFERTYFMRPVLSENNSTTAPNMYRSEPDTEDAVFKKNPTTAPVYFGRDYNTEQVVFERERRPWARSKQPERLFKEDQVAAEQARLSKEKHDLKVERQQFEHEKRRYVEKIREQERRSERQGGEGQHDYRDGYETGQGSRRSRERGRIGQWIVEDGRSSRRRRGGELSRRG